jgi:hypothetical protein
LKEAGAKEELIMLSKFIPLTDPETKITYPDMNVFDFTNEAMTGGGEDKTFADLIGSLTGEGVKKEKNLEGELNCPECGKPYYIFIDPASKELDLNNVVMSCVNCNITANGPAKWKYKWTVNEGLYHLWKQVIKMYSTGLPWCIIVYGERYWFQNKSGVGDGLILSAILKLVTLCTIYRGTVYFVKNEEEAVEVMKTFLRKSPELPRRWPIYNLFKKVEDDQVAMHTGIEGFGIEIARAIAEANHRPCDIGYDAKRVELGEMEKDAFLHKYGGNRKKDRETKVEGMAMEKAKILFRAYTDKWSE